MMSFKIRKLLHTRRSQEIVRQALTVPESERIAAVVMSALSLYLSKDEAILTWPTCTETHIAHFLRVVQLPHKFIAIGVLLIQEFARCNPKAYMEGHGAEMLFMAAVLDVAFKSHTEMTGIKHPYYDVLSVDYFDNRWEQATFEKTMHMLSGLLESCWQTCDTENYEALREIILFGKVKPSKERPMGLGIGVRSLRKGEDKMADARTAFFERVYLGNSYRLREDARQGPEIVGLVKTPRPHGTGHCEQRCILTSPTLRAQSRNLRNFSSRAQKGPWSMLHTTYLKGFTGRANLRDAKIRLVVHAGEGTAYPEILKKSVQVLPAVDHLVGAPKEMQFVNQVTESLYARSCVLYSRPVRPERKEMFLNEEEAMVYWKMEKAPKEERVYLESKFNLGVPGGTPIAYRGPRREKPVQNAGVTATSVPAPAPTAGSASTAQGVQGVSRGGQGRAQKSGVPATSASAPVPAVPAAPTAGAARGVQGAPLGGKKQGGQVPSQKSGVTATSASAAARAPAPAAPAPTARTPAAHAPAARAPAARAPAAPASAPQKPVTRARMWADSWIMRWSERVRVRNHEAAVKQKLRAYLNGKKPE